jgi:hypothetical protein
VLFINVPVGIAVIAITPLFITESPRQPGRFDVTGAVTSIAGMTALVYAFIRAASDGWADRLTLAAFAVAAVMLAAFLLTESRARQPITPLRLFTSPARAGSYLARLLLVAGMFGMFFFLTQFVQDILGLSPLAAGFAFLPMTLTVFGVSRAAPRLLPRFGPTRLMVAGMLPVIGGMAWLAQVSTQTTYLGGVLGPMLLIGTGMGIVFVPLTMVSLAGVAPADSGAASSMVNVTQQVGGSLGLAILVTVFGSAYRDAARHLAPGVSQVSAGRQLLVRGLHGGRRLRRVRSAGHPADQPEQARAAGSGRGPPGRRGQGGQHATVTGRTGSPAGNAAPAGTMAAVPPYCRAASGRASAGVATTVVPWSSARSRRIVYSRTQPSGGAASTTSRPVTGAGADSRPSSAASWAWVTGAACSPPSGRAVYGSRPRSAGPAVTGGRSPRDSSDQNGTVPAASSKEMTCRTHEPSAALSAAGTSGPAVMSSRAPQSVSCPAIMAIVLAAPIGDGTPPAALIACTAST